jgi:hypothetical protein
MTKKFAALQSLILAGGSIFAWYTVFGDFKRFLNAGGEILNFSGCRFPNPLATPCFYGAIVFLIALIWSVLIYQKIDNTQRLASQKKLNFLLLAGTIFAWSNFGYEMYKFYQPHTEPFLSCSGTLAQHPIYTPCFTGAIIYLAAFITSLIFVKALKKDAQQANI